MKRTVHKFGTGHLIPEGAKYLCTQVEARVTTQPSSLTGETVSFTENIFVWHYYEVEVPND